MADGSGFLIGGLRAGDEDGFLIRGLRAVDEDGLLVGGNRVVTERQSAPYPTAPTIEALQSAIDRLYELLGPAGHGLFEASNLGPNVIGTRTLVPHPNAEGEIEYDPGTGTYRILRENNSGPYVAFEVEAGEEYRVIGDQIDGQSARIFRDGILSNANQLGSNINGYTDQVICPLNLLD
ncbi:hypothetical protein HUK65_17265 [Rhodobacteraceae bacterium 2376]|uniref:Uncharacterized protein n=1 Tax=Rhabdonatronobacter sediminivivens TaxID=2743469 RepID=A0A7Z0I3C7_9RHOB|nr:hypothetical protein [Rhabdonatronobacter sediminivivens]NYS26729.1 hypothetical protein [Rhabdonatronobacter sediminivivens]